MATLDEPGRGGVDVLDRELEKLLHYRMVDVSTVKELVRRWYGDGAPYKKPESDHTALADVRQSIAELADYRRRFLVPPS